jgi:hypothetical protein
LKIPQTHVILKLNYHYLIEKIIERFVSMRTFARKLALILCLSLIVAVLPLGLQASLQGPSEPSSKTKPAESGQYNSFFRI